MMNVPVLTLPALSEFAVGNSEFRWAMVGVLIVVGLLLSAFFSGAETGLYCVNRLRLHVRAGQRDPRALRVAGVLQDTRGALSVTLVGTNLMNYLTTSSVAYLLGTLVGLGEIDTQLYTIAVLTPIVFVFAEVVPKNLFRLHADDLLARGSHLLAIANRLLRLGGVVWGLKVLADLAGRMAGGDSTRDREEACDPKRRMAELLQEAMAGQTPGQAASLGVEKSALVDRVCRLSETPLHSVMVPRNRVRVIAAGCERRELLKTARRTSHAQLPVYETHRRHIIGLVRVNDLLVCEDWRSVGERVSPATTLNPHETVASTITALQRAGQDMAVVTDRGGQMLGIVTLRDLIEAVVGELTFDD